MESKKDSVGNNIISIEFIFSILIIVGIVSIISYVSLVFTSNTKKIGSQSEATIILTNALENINSRDYENFSEYIENISILGLTKSIENGKQYITVNGDETKDKFLGVVVPEGYILELVIEDLNHEFDIIKKIDISITYDVQGLDEELKMTTIIQNEMIDNCNEPNFTTEYFLEAGVDVENYEIIPIKYSENVKDYIVTTSADSEWYNYSSKEWAKVLILPKRSSIDLKSMFIDATGVVNSQDESIENYMYVWIPNFSVKNNQSYFRYGASKNIIKMDFKYIDGKYLYLNTVGEEIENISKECSFSGIAGVWRNINSEDIYTEEFNKTKYGPIERH